MRLTFVLVPGVLGKEDSHEMAFDIRLLLATAHKVVENTTSHKNPKCCRLDHTLFCYLTRFVTIFVIVYFSFKALIFRLFLDYKILSTKTT